MEPWVKGTLFVTSEMAYCQWKWLLHLQLLLWIVPDEWPEQLQTLVFFPLAAAGRQLVALKESVLN